MRFACEQCQTKYSIPDERVRGKILKIRCKNCSSLISVSESGARTARAEPAGGSGMASLGGDNEGGGDSTMIGGMADFFGKLGQAPPEADEWHLSVDGNQNGPMPLADLAQRVSEQAGTSAELYVWKEGFDGWKALETVPEVQAAVEKAKGAPPRAVPAPKAAAPLVSLESDGGGDATQIGSLNLPLDLGKPEDDVQDASMMSLDSESIEALTDVPQPPKPASKPAPPPPKPPPPFKAPPPAKAPPAADNRQSAPRFMTLPHPGLRAAGMAPPAEPTAPPPAEPPKPAPAPAQPSPPPASPPPDLGSLIPSSPTPISSGGGSGPANLPSAEPSVMAALQFSGPTFGSPPAATPPSSESPVPERSKLPLFIVLGLVLAIVGGGAFVIIGKPGKSDKGKVETASSDGGAPDGGAAEAKEKTAKTEDKSAAKKSELEGISDDDFKSLLSAGEEGLGKCYAKALKKDASLGGKKLKIEVEVTLKGKAAEVIIDGLDSGDKLTKCMDKALKKWKFPKAEDKKPYKARFPLTISKE